jgi:hypothetical protein
LRISVTPAGAAGEDGTSAGGRDSDDLVVTIGNEEVVGAGSGGRNEKCCNQSDAD